jgi:hypothetical protein
VEFAEAETISSFIFSSFYAPIQPVTQFIHILKITNLLGGRAEADNSSK